MGFHHQHQHRNSAPEALGIPLTQLIVTVSPVATGATGRRLAGGLWEVTYQASWVRRVEAGGFHSLVWDGMGETMKFRDDLWNNFEMILGIYGFRLQ